MNLVLTYPGFRCPPPPLWHVYIPRWKAKVTRWFTPSITSWQMRFCNTIQPSWQGAWAASSASQACRARRERRWVSRRQALNIHGFQKRTSLGKRVNRRIQQGKCNAFLLTHGCCFLTKDCSAFKKPCLSKAGKATEQSTPLGNLLHQLRRDCSTAFPLTNDALWYRAQGYAHASTLLSPTLKTSVDTHWFIHCNIYSNLKVRIIHIHTYI